MVVQVDVIIIRNVPSLYLFYLVTPAARKWVKNHVSKDREMVGNVLKVERKFGWDIAYGMNCDGLRLQLAILAALSQFERERLRERTIAGLERARAQGKRLERPSEPVPVAKLEAVKGISVREGARRLGVARSTLQRWRALARQNPSVEG
jgi:Resolvase, N terminal domain